MFIRITALAALSVTVLAAQAIPAVSSPASSSTAPVQSAIPELQPDQNDPMVVRAKMDLERIQQLVTQGALPRLRLEKAQDDLADALDMSILKNNIYSKDILPEQADQMVLVAQRMVLRRQRSMIRMQQLVGSGVISQAEAQFSAADMSRSQTELDLAITRANVVRELAEQAKIQKSIATFENEAEAHPEWSGRVYTRYDGNGMFSLADRQKVAGAFFAHFLKPLPISADGETAVHRSLGFDHRGRIDVGIAPDSPEGSWLISFLEQNHIPFFAFRQAVPGRATGAHIHIGPQSTRLAASARVVHARGQHAAGAGD